MNYSITDKYQALKAKATFILYDPFAQEEHYEFFGVKYVVKFTNNIPTEIECKSYTTD